MGLTLGFQRLFIATSERFKRSCGNKTVVVAVGENNQTFPYEVIGPETIVLTWRLRMPSGAAENFSNDRLDSWTILDDSPPFSGPSNWFVQDGILRQTSNIWAYPPPDEFVYHLGTKVIAGSSLWKDYSFNVLIKSTDDDGIGIIFRYADEKNYYRLLMLTDPNNGGPVQKLQKFNDGQIELIEERRIPNPVPKGWFALTADVRGDTIKIYLNEEIIFSISDLTHKDGKIGLLCYANSGANFDSISVTRETLVYGKPDSAESFIERKPYIQLPETSSVHVLWKSRLKTIGRIEFGKTTAYGTETTESDSSLFHQIKIQF